MFVFSPGLSLRRCLFIWLLFSPAWTTASVSADDRPHHILTVNVSEFPPYIHARAEGGFFIDVLEELARRTGMKLELRMMPWVRAQHETAGDSSMAIAPLTRTAARESRYQWITPVLSDPYYLYQLEGQSEPDDITLRLSQIVVQRDSPGELILASNGFTNLFATNSERIAARMFLHGRSEFWFVRQMVARDLVREHKRDFNDLQALMGFETAPMYLAAGKGMSPARVQQLRVAMENMRKDGTYDLLLQKYYHGASE